MDSTAGGRQTAGRVKCLPPGRVHSYARELRRGRNKGRGGGGICHSFQIISQLMNVLAGAPLCIAVEAGPKTAQISAGIWEEDGRRERKRQENLKACSAPWTEGE